MFRSRRIPVGTRVLYKKHDADSGKDTSCFGVIDHYDNHGNAMIADTSKRPHIREVQVRDIISKGEVCSA